MLDASGPSLEVAIQQIAKEGNVIRTDVWIGYNNLEDLGYEHEIVYQEADVGDNLLLPRCQKVASLLKRWLLGTYQGGISLDHLEYYFDEYTFRFNRRTSRSRRKLFYPLLQQVVITDPTQYQTIPRDFKTNLYHTSTTKKI